jgi:methylase of polypeptide subunit release factors
MDLIETIFKIGGREIALNNSNSAFQPNQVTKLVYESVRINDGDIGIEVGAGIGPGTIFLASNPAVRKFYAIEPVELQFKLLEQNFTNHNLSEKVQILRGSLFEPLKHSEVKGDFIVSDASGMDYAGQLLGWYPDGIPLGGEKGEEVTVELLRNAKEFLNLKNPNVRVYFPIIEQFANGDAILAEAQRNFRLVRTIAEQNFPLREDALKKLNEANYNPHAPFKERASRKLWTARIYEATRPFF